MQTEQVDVLVIGFGAAGASAALAARAGGAAVRVVEKCSAGGGNCRHSGGFLFEIDGPGTIDHLDGCASVRPMPTCCAPTCAACASCRRGCRSSAAGPTRSISGPSGGMLPSWPHFPGAGQVGYRQFAGDGTRPGIASWELLERSVDAAGIPVTLGASVTRLIVRDGTVRGAVVGGRDVEASGGVILACSGIEYDAEMRDAFLPLSLVPVGHPGNTGDTLRLAAQAGASLWHLSAFFGWPAYRHPDHLAAFTLDVHAPSFLYVDADGRRFADETGWEVHDKIRAWTARANSPAELAARVGLDPAVLAATLDDYVAAAA